MNKLAKISLFKSPEESPGFLLWHISLSWRSCIEETLKRFDLTHPQFVVLATTAWLTREGDHISQSDIGKSAGLDPNTTSQILRGLEVKSFIKRTRALNERSKNPTVTKLGLDVFYKALPAVEETDAQFFQTLTQKNLDDLIKLFQKLMSTKISL